MQTSWTPAKLDGYRLKMDPTADAIIKGIFENNLSSMLRSSLMQMETNNYETLVDKFKDAMSYEPLGSFIKAELTQEFTEQDIAMFRKTHEIWKKHGVRYIYTLLFRSLPFTYAAEKPANVLRLTNLIKEHPARRVLETAQFVFDVMDENWWEKDRRGIMTAIKVRLLHAAMRYMLEKGEAAEPWNYDWGMPISQEDMVATNQVFSLTFFKGMELMHEPLGAEEMEAWFYSWRKMAKIMGVEDDLLMPNVASAWELQHSIYEHLFNGPVHTSGIELAAVLVKMFKDFHMSEVFVLLQMKKMMVDETVPGVFYTLLEPTYGAAYPDLFADNGEHPGHNYLEEHHYDKFKIGLRDFFERITELRRRQIAEAEGNATGVTSITDKQLVELAKVLNDLNRLPVAGTLIHSIEDILEEASEVLHKIVNAVKHLFGEVEEEGKHFVTRLVHLKDELMKKALDIIGLIIIDILTVIFRPGKLAGFYISDDLKQHWMNG